MNSGGAFEWLDESRADEYRLLVLDRWLLGGNDDNTTDSTSTSTNSSSSSNYTTTNNGTTCDDLARSNDAGDLRITMRLYGSIFVLVLIILCHVRRRYPKAYSLRSTVPHLHTDLAMDSRGAIEWMWKLFGIADVIMMDDCGMDALCYARVLEFGMKLAIVGMLNSLWLIPVYVTAETSDITICIHDWVVASSISHVPSGSNRFIAAVLGAYCIFGYTMYAILQEFVWFSRYRHSFLSKKMPRNFAVYVQCIPTEYQTNQKLLQFFQQTSATPDAVLDAHLAIQTPNLQNKVLLRQQEVARLEHAINLEDVHGIVPNAGRILRSPNSLTQDLTRKVTTLNQEISEAIDQIQRQAQGLPVVVEEDILPTRTLRESDSYIHRNINYGGTDERSKLSGMSLSVDTTGTESLQRSTRIASERTRVAVGDASAYVSSGIRNSLHTAASAATSAANMARSLLERQDGQPYSAGFVTFTSLRAVQAAKQMVQYSEPFAMEVLEAPQPEDVFWKNVGKTHEQLTFGKLISFGLTVALCLFWTVPMSFISSLSSIEGLRGQFEFIDTLLTQFPHLQPLFAQLAPLLIIVANNVLKIVLQLLSGLEGPISGAVVSAKLFTKLSSFMIIQTFFVTAISGSILDELSAMLKDSSIIIDLLAQSLPRQSTFFIQILIVDTCISMGVELLRVVPLTMALLRRCFGPRLTKKERETTWMGLRPLNDPSEFSHAEVLASTVLYYTVFFVYATLAPITTWFMLLCFTFLSVGYRHQFVYIYPTFPDSGGKLWVAFFKLLPILMIIAQVTMVGVLALSKSAVASSLMLPLLVCTILFTIYINQQHFAMTEYLPAKDALLADLRHNADGEINFDFLKDKYVQPELRDREVWPENLNVEREIEHGCLSFDTPPGSDAGDLEDVREPLMVLHDGSLKKLGRL